MITSQPYALIATDLDGTLLRAGDTVSDRTRAALARAAGAGARHLVATGRPVPQVLPLLAELGYRGLAVCGQGAQVYDTVAGAMISSLRLDRDLAETAVGKIEAEVGAVFLAVNQSAADGLTLAEREYRMPHPTLPATRVAERVELWAEPINKVLVRHPVLSDEELVEAARDIVGDLVTVTMAGADTVEIQPFGVSKATGLAVAAEWLGLGPEDTIAFGDMPNDIPMFEWVAHGVAMANAHPELKSVADEITLSNEDDGIAVILERLYGKSGGVPCGWPASRIG